MIRIGTRGSALALAQAGWVAARLPHAELVTITTSGDRGEAVGDKSRWTSTLEAALLAGEIDLAVHSAKDVPGELAPGTAIAAVPARASALDALCGFADFASIAPGARVGTSSIRRTAQLRAKREDVQVVELQGNVDTRLRRLAAGDVDALVLACAGLIRLGRESEISGVLDLVPAPGQGALLVQARIDDEQTRAVAAELNDPIAERCVMSERALASHLNATCNTPLGASAVPASDTDATLRAAVSASDTDVTLRAWIGLPDGSHWIQDELTGDASDVGSMVAERMIAAGASALLEQAERMALA